VLALRNHLTQKTRNDSSNADSLTLAKYATVQFMPMYLPPCGCTGWPRQTRRFWHDIQLGAFHLVALAWLERDRPGHRCGRDARVPDCSHTWPRL